MSQTPPQRRSGSAPGMARADRRWSHLDQPGLLGRNDGYAGYRCGPVPTAAVMAETMQRPATTPDPKMRSLQASHRVMRALPRSEFNDTGHSPARPGSAPDPAGLELRGGFSPVGTTRPRIGGEISARQHAFGPTVPGHPGSAKDALSDTLRTPKSVSTPDLHQFPRDPRGAARSPQRQPRRSSSSSCSSGFDFPSTARRSQLDGEHQIHVPWTTVYERAAQAERAADPLKPWAPMRQGTFDFRNQNQMERERTDAHSHHARVIESVATFEMERRTRGEDSMRVIAQPRISAGCRSGHGRVLCPYGTGGIQRAL